MREEELIALIRKIMSVGSEGQRNAIVEAVLSALQQRDCSEHSEGKAISIEACSDRIEVINREARWFSGIMQQG